MTDKEEKVLGVSVARDGTTIVGNLNPSAPDNEKIVLSKDQTKMLAEIRRQSREDD